MTLEELEQFGTTYEQIQEKAYNLYNTLDQLDKKYKFPNSYTSDGRYDFDHFTIESNYIELHGSYSVQGDWGNKSYTLTLQEFFDSDEYLIQYEQKLKDRLEEYNQKEKNRKTRVEELERETYLKLKAKYEGPQNE